MNRVSGQDNYPSKEGHYDRQMDRLDGLIELQTSWLAQKGTAIYEKNLPYIEDLNRRINKLNRTLS